MNTTITVVYRCRTNLFQLVFAGAPKAPPDLRDAFSLTFSGATPTFPNTDHLTPEQMRTWLRWTRDHQGCSLSVVDFLWHPVTIDI